MSDPEKKEPLINDQAKTMITGEAQGIKKAKIKNTQGEEFESCALTMNDMLEFEERLGISLLDAVSQRLTSKHLAQICFYAARKSGLSRSQILKKEFRFSFEEFCEGFDFSFFLNGGATFAVTCLRLSGILTEKKNPTSKANPKEQDKSDSTSAEPLKVEQTQ